jgi:F0F1-type ATP synthase membrane subunit b/b'
MENIDISLIVAQLINFLLLFYLFKRYIAKHLNAVIEKRNATVEKVRTFESSYDTKIRDLEIREQQMMADARKHVQELSRNSENISHAKSEEIIAIAHAQALQILE